MEQANSLGASHDTDAGFSTNVAIVIETRLLPERARALQLCVCVCAQIWFKFGAKLSGRIGASSAKLSAIELAGCNYVARKETNEFPSLASSRPLVGRPSGGERA